MKFAVLGGGMVGGVIARELASDVGYDVTVFDNNPERLRELSATARLNVIQQDLADTVQLGESIVPFDLVVSAVPGFLGYKTSAAVLTAGKHLVDIAFFPEEPDPLDEIAKAKGVVFVPDCGVAPGLSNLLTGNGSTYFDRLHSVEIYVGGLPRERSLPFQYKAPFSPIDVLEEYLREVRMVENGREVVKPALSEVELRHVPGIGTLEAFNTDGLRSLRKSISAPVQKEKTLRYPGHADRISFLKDIGLLSKEPIRISGKEIVPIEVAAALLFPLWTFASGEPDLTVLEVILEGERDQRKVRRVYFLLDTFDHEGGISSMARTTGYPAATVARMIMDGTIREPGLQLPETIGKNRQWFDSIRTRLETSHGIRIHEREEVLPSAE